MKKYYLYLILVVLYFDVYSQTNIKDATTKNSIEFAAIYNKNSKTGTYSDQNGCFKIDANPNDTIVISCVGYYSDTLIFANDFDDDIFLTPKLYQIDEATISINVSTKKYELGFRKEKDKTTFYSHIGSEWVAFIDNKNPKQKKIIESIILKTSSKPKKNIAYRINIYEKDSLSGLPGNDLANLPIYQSKIHKGNKYDLNDKLILPDNGIFVGIEWISYLDENNKKMNTGGNIALSVPLVFSVNESKTYWRSKFYENKWSLAKNDHPLSQIQNKDNPPNLGISINVKEFQYE